MLRVFYTAGPGNAFDIFKRWKTGAPDLTTSHVPYSGQMFEACKRHGASALITCTHLSGEEQSAGEIAIRRRKDPTAGKTGLAWHLGFAAKARQNIRDAVAFGANVVVISEDTNPAHYAPLARRGVQIVQVLHTRLWARDHNLSFLQRHRMQRYGRAYGRGDVVVLSSSDVVTDQVRQVTRGAMPPVIEFLPLYQPDHYTGLAPATIRDGRADILFIGRVEETKGALDLVAIAALLRARGLDFRFRICGIGNDLDRMKQLASDEGLNAHFTFEGWCDRDKLREVMSDCAFSIIPTRSAFIEGFNHVVVESVLAGRPALASDICPAVNYVGEAAIAVPADNIAAYADAITRLLANPDQLQRHIAACPAAGARFLDPGLSFGAALDRVFTACTENRLPEAGHISPEPR